LRFAQQTKKRRFARSERASKTDGAKRKFHFFAVRRQLDKYKKLHKSILFIMILFIINKTNVRKQNLFKNPVEYDKNKQA
jgi:hypothetical protein